LKCCYFDTEIKCFDFDVHVCWKQYMLELKMVKERSFDAEDVPADDAGEASEAASEDSDDDGGRGRPLAAVACDGGRIKVYCDEKTEDIYMLAVCDCDHNPCCKRRTCLPSRHKPPRPAQGRPLGYLAAWLMAGRGCDVVSAAYHGKRVKVTPQQRRDARRRILEVPGGTDLASWERLQRAGEPCEPLNQP
jgi:hypothetical protein